ncbi:hypothetical protein V2J09_016635 [Rumex salicifolius]
MNIALFNCSSTTSTCSAPQLLLRRTTTTTRCASSSSSSSSSSIHFPTVPSSIPAALVASRNPNSYSVRRSVVLDDAEETTLGTYLSDGYCTRRLILLRHADSSWEDPSLRDHDRPLSKAGRDDAVSVSLNLQKIGWVPELILSSNAFRTRETLLIMQQHVKNFLEAEVHFISSFYSVAAMDGQTAEHLQKHICQFSRNDILTVMCMGHNKGWQEAATMFTGTSIELKTCHAALLEAPGRSWEEVFASAGFGGWKLYGIIGPNVNH